MNEQEREMYAEIYCIPVSGLGEAGPSLKGHASPKNVGIKRTCSPKNVGVKRSFGS